jgi:hypothetical protein
LPYRDEVTWIGIRIICTFQYRFGFRMASNDSNI